MILEATLCLDCNNAQLGRQDQAGSRIAELLLNLSQFQSSFNSHFRNSNAEFLQLFRLQISSAFTSIPAHSQTLKEKTNKNRKSMLVSTALHNNRILSVISRIIMIRHNKQHVLPVYQLRYSTHVRGSLP